MSFGFSVGDFLAVGKLVADIVTSLRSASIAEYRELICELHGLQQALYELDEFGAKLKKFERLEIAGGKTRSRLETMKVCTRKLQRGCCMKEEVEKLRTYIVVHVGSLNMRLITQGL